MRFIKLTHAQLGTPVYVAAEHVACVSSTPRFWNMGGFTRVHFVGGESAAVVESVESVMAALGHDARGKAIDDLS